MSNLINEMRRALRRACCNACCGGCLADGDAGDLADLSRAVRNRGRREGGDA